MFMLDMSWKNRYRYLSYCCSVHKYIWSRSKNIPVNMLHFYRTTFVILQIKVNKKIVKIGMCSSKIMTILVR